MDKNQAIGLVLISVLLISYIYFFVPTPPPPGEQNQTTEQSVDTSKKAVNPQISVPNENDSTRNLENQQKFGDLASAATGNAKSIRIENEDIILKLNTHGGKIEYLELKKYKTYEQEPLVLLDEEKSNISMMVNTQQGNIDLKDLYFETDATGQTVNAGDTLKVTFTINMTGGGALKQVYSIPGKGYEIGYQILTDNTGNLITNNNVHFVWDNQLLLLEKDIKESRRRAYINYYTTQESFDYIGAVEDNSTKEEAIEEPVKWVSLKQRFFSSAVIADSQFQKVAISTTGDPSDSNLVNISHVDLNFSLSETNNGSGGFSYFFGPNQYEIMKDVTAGFGENVDFGWKIISWINKHFVQWVFVILEKFISNYGLIIIILVLLVRAILFPLSYKSYKSMAKTKVLKPELDEIKKKYGDDMQKAQSEQMKLYQQVGVNPLSGCIPLLLQMPILLSMFYFFPNAIELRQESFLWAEDLSTYDAIISWSGNIPLLTYAFGNHISLFTLLMTASTILYTWSNSQVATVQGPMKFMQYFFPLIFMFVLNSYPAALSFYYFVSNIVSFGQQVIIRRFVDEDKIRRALDENRKRNVNKKKSKFQMRLEDAMKTSEEVRKKKDR